MTNESVEIECEYCGYNWNYTGNAKRATCPSCGLNNTYEQDTDTNT